MNGSRLVVSDELPVRYGKEHRGKLGEIYRFLVINFVINIGTVLFPELQQSDPVSRQTSAVVCCLLGAFSGNSRGRTRSRA